MGADENNFLSLYSETVNPIIRSGKRTCTTGPFAGEGKYFEFFLKPSTEKNNKFVVHVKYCYPSSSCENAKYNVVSAKLVSSDDKVNPPEFSIGDFSLHDKSPVEGKEAEDESTTVSWLSLTVKEIISVEFRDGRFMRRRDWIQAKHKILTFRICICKESWGNYPVNMDASGSGSDDAKNKDVELNMDEGEASGSEKAPNGLMSKIASLWISPALAPLASGDKLSLV